MAFKSKKRTITWIVTIVMLAVLGYFGAPFVKLAIGLNNKGVFDAPKTATYSGDTKENLQALYTALMFVHESDGQFPNAAQWMDKVEPRLKAYNVNGVTSKLHDPTLGDSPTRYGFAMNDACSGRYKGDLPTGTILLFTSQDTVRNAHGDPKTSLAQPPRTGGNWGITVKGDMVKL
jgi:predicted RND superfamily exporter protein